MISLIMESSKVEPIETESRMMATRDLEVGGGDWAAVGQEIQNFSYTGIE
jgi:hypothetical protein